MADLEPKVEEFRMASGRGPAYPYVSLEKAVERAYQLQAANMARNSFAPLAVYKVWGWSGDNGNARQTMAALSHFGLMEYVGRGDARTAKLSNLAHRIVFDKVPDSKERAVALREAALTPAIYQKLWNEYKDELPPDVVIETFLVRDCGYNEGAARNVISGYRDTIEFAGLNQPGNLPPETTSDDTAQGITPSANLNSETPQRLQIDSVRPQPAASNSITMPTATGENDIKILLDGDRLRVSAYVDLKGAKRLVKALKANMALLEEEEEEE
jgi:hypothetical protein